LGYATYGAWGWLLDLWVRRLKSSHLDGLVWSVVNGGSRRQLDEILAAVDVLVHKNDLNIDSCLYNRGHAKVKSLWSQQPACPLLNS